MQSATSVDALFNNDYNDYFNKGFTQTTIISEGMIQYYHDYWEILHLIGYLYPEHPTYFQKVQIEILFDYMQKGGIPCTTCTTEFRKFLKENNLHQICRNRNNLKKFMIDLHNYVNENLRKDVLDYTQVDQLYSDLKNKCERIESKYGFNIEELIENGEVYSFIDYL